MSTAFVELVEAAGGLHIWLGTGLPGLDPGQALLLAFDGVELIAAGATGEAILELGDRETRADAALDGFALSVVAGGSAEQIATAEATGTLRVGDEERRLRGTAVFGRLPDPGGSPPELMRALSALPGAAGGGLAAVALQPSGAPGHDSERLQAWLLSATEIPRPVDEPLLSTQYDDAGAQARAGLELWVGGGDHLPLRVPGVRTVDTALRLADGWEVRAALFDWFLEGSHARGSYLIWRHGDA